MLSQISRKLGRWSVPLLHLPSRSNPITINKAAINSVKSERNLSVTSLSAVAARDLGKLGLETEAVPDSCPVCSKNITFSHRDVLFLAQFLSHDGYVVNRRITGVCKRQQRRITKKIAIARRLGILPNFVAKDQQQKNQEVS